MIARRSLVAAVAVVSAVLAACGGSEPASSPATTASTAASLPVTLTDDAGHEVTITSIDRIIPVNGDLAEVVFALGLGDQVAATDLSATYPPEADAKPEIGYQRALQAEPILALDPTVILADELAGPVEVLDQLRSAGVPVVVINRDRTIDGAAAKVRAVGEALGVPDRADVLAEQIEADIDEARAEAAEYADRPRVLVLYLRGERVQLVFGEGSGVDVMIEAAGGIDVGTELGVQDNQPLTAEAVLAANPDVIVTSTTGIESVGGIDGLLELNGIERTAAGRSGRILSFDAQYLFGVGPRSGQLVGELVRALHDPSTPSPSTPSPSTSSPSTTGA